MKATDESTAAEAAIWRRAMSGDNESWSPGVAESVLRFKLPRADIERMNELSEKAQSGTLNPEERAEAESYDRVGLIIELMQSKARQSLK